MDVVYVLGRGSTWGNNEIRYSLRSVEKYLKGYDKIFIVGELPDFVQNVIHIPCQNIHNRPQKSIFTKILQAVKDERVSENFIHFADDYYLLQDVEELGHYNNGLLSERIIKYAGRYRQAMQNSMEAGAVYNYDIHTPFIYNKSSFISSVSGLDWEKEYVIKSVYMKDRSGEYLDDCKINRGMEYRVLLRTIEGKRFLSSGLLCPAMREYLKRTFKEKSSYER